MIIASGIQILMTFHDFIEKNIRKPLLLVYKKNTTAGICTPEIIYPLFYLTCIFDIRLDMHVYVHKYEHNLPFLLTSHIKQTPLRQLYL